jgi:hypothetical protein
MKCLHSMCTIETKHNQHIKMNNLHFFYIAIEFFNGRVRV